MPLVNQHKNHTKLTNLHKHDECAVIKYCVMDNRAHEEAMAHSLFSSNDCQIGTNKAKRKMRFTLSIAVAAFLASITACTSAPTTKTTNAQPSYRTLNSGGLDDQSTDSLEELLEATDMRAVESSRIDVLRYGDLWNRVRAGFKLDLTQDNARIRRQQSWFTARQVYINRLTARASYYLYYTILEAERRGIPTELALLPVIESSYDPTATSNAAAAGMWQFIPSTGRIYGLRQTSSYDGRRDVIESTRAAYDFLTSLYNKFGSWELALAAYNCGPGCVNRAIKKNEKRGRATDFWSLDLPTETENYVPRFLAVAKIIKNPSAYGVSLPNIANRPHFRSIPIQSGITLRKISQLTGVDIEHLQDLNPGFVQGQTHHDGPNRLLVPSTMSYALDGKITALGSGLWAQNVSSFEASGASPVKSLSNDEAAQLLSSTSAQSAENPLSLQEKITAKKLPVEAESKANTRASSTDLRAAFYEKKRTKLPTSASALAEFASKARVPNQTASYIQPKPSKNSLASSTVQSSVQVNKPEPVQDVSDAEVLEAQKQELQAQVLAEMNALPTSAAQVTKNDTVVQYPALSKQEREEIAAEIKQANPDVQVIDPLDGEIKLDAIQTQQSILNAQGKKRELTFSSTRKDKSTQEKPTSKLTQKPKDKRTVYKVESGDTLLKIAKRFSLSWRDIAEWNQIKPQDNLPVGLSLYLYGAKVPKVKLEQQPKTQTYQVQKGDGLIALANDFNMSVEMLADMNKMSPRNDLLLGQTIVIPASVDLEAYKKTKAEEKKPARYRVQPGDTMIGVAAKFNLSASELARLNDMKALDGLRIGQVLTLVADGKQSKLVKSKQQSSTTKNAPKKDTQKNENKPTSYVVESGDTMIYVARKFGVSTNNLAKWNGLKTTDGLRIGQKLTLIDGSKSADKSAKTPDLKKPKRSSKKKAKYSSYKVKSGDGLIMLARKYGVSTDELATINKLKPNDDLQIGQIIKVPSQ